MTEDGGARHDAGAPDEITLSVAAERPGGIELRWDAGSLNLGSFIVRRDGLTIAVLPGSAREFVDLDAGSGVLATVDAGATRFLSSGIELTWDLNSTSGRFSTYDVIAQTLASNSVRGARAAPSLTGWLITRTDGGSVTLAPSERTWLDSDSTPPRSVGVPGIRAWADDSTSSVMLSTDASIVAVDTQYEVAPLTSDGFSSAEVVSGARGGNPVLQWQRSSDDSPTTFIDLPFVHGPKWFDAEAVFNEGRYYRLVVKSGSVIIATSAPARALLWRPRLMAASSVVCILRDDDVALCSSDGFASGGRLQDVVAFVTDGQWPCALHSDAGVTCLRNGSQEQIALPPVTQLVGDDRLCGLSASGWVCAGSAPPPASGFSTVSPRNWGDTICGRTLADAGVTCASNPVYASIYAPIELGHVELFGMGNAQVCAIADGGVRCLHRHSGIYTTLPETLPSSPLGFTDITVTGANYGFCVRQTDGYVRCTAERSGVFWGSNPPVTSEPFDQYALSSFGPMLFGCGLTPAHRLRCGGRDFRQLPPTQPVRQVEIAGNFAAYFLLENGRLAVRGEMQSANGPGPDDRFVQVSNGIADGRTCALRVDGTALCWSFQSMEPQPAPGARFKTIAVGPYSSCGLQPGGTISCWRGTWVPTGTFIGLMLLNSSLCGQRADLSLSCDVITFPALSPTQRYSKISSSHSNACGIRIDGSLECWPTPAPSSTLGLKFVDISSAFSSSACAVEEDGRLHCWGLSNVTPPWTDFVSVKLNGGGGLGCGVRADGTATCWGQYQWSYEP